MYSDEKKLISDISRKKNLDENVKNYAESLLTADFEYACQKFALNYVVFREQLADKDIADDPYIYECATGINKLTGMYIAGERTDVADTDISYLAGIRNRITKKVKVLTAYTDAFELYEYILNRKEYEYEENQNEALSGEFDSFDAHTFAEEIFRFLFSDADKVSINERIRQVTAQLPVRMTKAKFFDILGQTLSIYSGCERSSFYDFVEMLEEAAFLSLPEQFDTEYSALHEAYEQMQEGDYAHLDFDAYRSLSTTLDKSAGFINDVMSDYLLLMELVNDLYSMMLCVPEKERVSDACRHALDLIGRVHTSMSAEDSFPENVYELLAANEGAQEEAGERRIVLAAAVPDVESIAQAEIVRQELSETYQRIDTIEKLLSGSLFVDIETVRLETGQTVNSNDIVQTKNRLTEEFGMLFEKNSQAYNRAVMAKIFEMIPVFFNSQQEIRAYIENALVRCSSRSEKMACYEILKELMEGYRYDD